MFFTVFTTSVMNLIRDFLDLEQKYVDLVIRLLVKNLNSKEIVHILSFRIHDTAQFFDDHFETVVSS